MSEEPRKRGRPLGSRNKTPKTKPVDVRKPASPEISKELTLFTRGDAVVTDPKRPGRKRKHPIKPFVAENQEDFVQQLNVAEKMDNIDDNVQQYLEDWVSRTVEVKRDTKRKRAGVTTRSSYQTIGPPPVRPTRKDISKFGMAIQSLHSQLRKLVANTGSHLVLYVIPPHSVDLPTAPAQSKECMFYHGNVSETLRHAMIATAYHQSSAEEKIAWEIAYKKSQDDAGRPRNARTDVLKPIHISVSNIFNTELTGPNPHIQTAANTGPYPPVRAQQTLTAENYMKYDGFLPGQKIETPRSYEFATYDTSVLIRDDPCFKIPPLMIEPMYVE